MPPLRPAAALAVLLAVACGCAPAGRLAAGPAAQPLVVSGRLPADAVWGGVVEVADDVMVPRGRTLRILAGSRIVPRPADTSRTEPDFLDNDTEILVRGRLVVEGARGRPVVFEPNEDAGPDGSWGGIIFDGGGGSVRHARIVGARTGVTCVGASPALADLEIAGGRFGIAVHAGSSPAVRRATVRAAETGVVAVAGSSPLLEGVDADGAEHEGLLAAPGSAPRLVASRFSGAVAGILWGAAEEPPAGAGTVLRRGAHPAADPPASPAFLRGPAVPPQGAPGRIYRGESFIGEDTTWEGEVLVDGTVMVSPEAHLRLEPGTVVRLAFRDGDGDGVGESEIFIQGRITAAGTPERPVVFTAAGEQGPGRWGAINIMGSDTEESAFTHCVVESSHRGLHSHFSRFRVERCVFRGNHRAFQFQESQAAVVDTLVAGGVSGMRFRDSTVALDGLVVAGNVLGVQMLRTAFTLGRSVIAGNSLAGLHLRECEGTISGSLLSGNSPGLLSSDSRIAIEATRVTANGIGGIMLRRTEAEVSRSRIAGNAGNGLSTDSAGLALRGSVVEGNLRFALESASENPVDATGNWWGPAGALPELIHDREDDHRLGPVLTAPVLDDVPAVP